MEGKARRTPNESILGSLAARTLRESWDRSRERDLCEERVGEKRTRIMFGWFSAVMPWWPERRPVVMLDHAVVAYYYAGIPENVGTEEYSYSVVFSPSQSSPSSSSRGCSWEFAKRAITDRAPYTSLTTSTNDPTVRSAA